ncbi:MAG: DNA repair protein RecN [Mariprofundus sp.]|nr:DNA repair protein RecN [Mariprofundus sp.]
MLISLSVKQFALIEQIDLELSAGMTVFTGETGAGKSMLGGALGAVFGARASADWVRHGADKAEVTGIWQGRDARLDALLDANDIEWDDELVLRRIVTAEGRSRAYINGVQVVLKNLQQVGKICLDMHGQHEHQSLMQPAVQQQLLDARLAPALLQDIGLAFDQWQQLQSRMQSLNAERSESEQQAVWMREQLVGLDALEVREGLTAILQSEVDAGRHHSRIQQAAAEAMILLDEAEPSVGELIARAGKAVADAEDFHAGLHRARLLIEQMDAVLGEITPELRHVLDQSFDEAGLHQSEQRLMALHEAMRRHDCDETGLMALMDDWRNRLAALDTAGWDEAALLKELELAAAQYRQCATALNAARMAVGETLVKQLRPFLNKLALGGMQVRFDVQAGSGESGLTASERTASGRTASNRTASNRTEPNWTASGWDYIGIKIMSNPGEPWRELATVASGGELSRLVLAFKGCGALTDMPQLAVFDEVDTGIGGETAWCVGELLSRMGKERQVLVISHLPQVAACADHQVVISKAEKNGRTITDLEPVQADSRQTEIARMLGGAGEQSLQHAAEILQRGQAALR